MERHYRRRYAVHRTSSRRGRTGSSDDKATQRRTIKLAACGIIFALAVFIKLLFPGFADNIGHKLTTTVDYKAALAALGEGISGDKKFTAAIGEAITYAFRGAAADDDVPESEDVSDITAEDAIDAFAEDNSGIPAWNTGDAETPSPLPDTEASDAEIPGTDVTNAGEQNDLANAIISAFLQTQEGYSDYDLPAGATYDMPVIGAAYEAPVSGNITSPFGYREHPIDGSVKFHYGIDIAAGKGAPVLAFSDGSILAVGDSTTLGKYIIITHDGFETLYAHCDDVHVSSGQAVKMGDLIADVGETGNATSYCLHFELKIGGVFVNPAYYIEATGV